MVKGSNMDIGICTQVYGQRYIDIGSYMHIGIWTKVYAHGYMDNCCSVVYCFKCVALRLRCDSMLLGFVVAVCYGFVSRCFSE